MNRKWTENGPELDGKWTGSKNFVGVLTDDADKFESESYEIPVGEYP